MALWVCDDCTTAYSVGAPACPACGSKDWSEQGAPEPEPKKAPAKKAAASREKAAD